jgi:hypothetical protein
VIPDASEAWHAFHYRSKRARRELADLPSVPYLSPRVPATEKPSEMSSEMSSETPNEMRSDAMVNDFNNLKSDLEEEGLFDVSYPHVLYRLMEILAIFLFGYMCLVNGFPLFGLFLLGVAQGRCGWLEHEGLFRRVVNLSFFMSCLLLRHSTDVFIRVRFFSKCSKKVKLF